VWEGAWLCAGGVWGARGGTNGLLVPNHLPPPLSLSPPPLPRWPSLTLTDPAFPSAISDPAHTQLWTNPFHAFNIDTHAPAVTFPCFSWNDTVRPTNDEALCVSCGDHSNETVLGCSVWWQLVSPGLRAPTLARLTGVTSGEVLVHSSHGDAVVLRVWAVDATGNVGPSAQLMWIVDSLVPVTVWPSELQNDSLVTSHTATEFIVSCSRPAKDCYYSYSFDQGPLVALGSGNHSAVTQSGPTVDTMVTRRSPHICNASSPVTVFMVQVLVNGSLVPFVGPSAASLQVRVDGAAMWVDVVASSTSTAPTLVFDPYSGLLTITGLSGGRHVLDARGVHPQLGVDTTAWTEVWFVDQLPSVTIVSKPPAYSEEPGTAASFVVSSSASEILVSYLYKVHNVESPASLTWLSSDVPVFEVTDLTPGLTYVFTVRAVSVTGLQVRWPRVCCSRDAAHPGPCSPSHCCIFIVMYPVPRAPVPLAPVVRVQGNPVTWSWRTASCESSMQFPPSLSIQHFSVSYGKRVFSWWSSASGAVAGSEPAMRVEYSVDGSEWATVATPSFTVDMLLQSSWHTLAVRLPAPAACAHMPPYPSTGVTWFEVEPPPGVPGVKAGPPTFSTSSYADFVFNSTAVADLVTFKYTLDGSSWSACDSSLRLGPLSSGSHSLQVASVAPKLSGAFAEGAAVVSNPVVYNWTVAVLSESTIALKDVQDGRHSVMVVASDPIGHVELQPVTRYWVVDTAPPRTVAVRLSSLASNSSIGVVSAACENEELPSRCTSVRLHRSPRLLPLSLPFPEFCGCPALCSGVAGNEFFTGFF
jgi:hypothetical protein